MIIDAQVHAYERDRPERPWAAVLHGPPEVTGDQMIAAMDEVGVDAAILVSPWTMYRFDYSYALEVQRAHPDRFGLVAPMDARRDDVGEAVEEWAAQPGAVGARLMFYGGAGIDPAGPGVDSVAKTAGDRGLPLNVLCPGRPDIAATIARRHADTQIVVDHLGSNQPFEPPVPDEPFAAWPGLLALADLPNVAVKVTGACTMSRQGRPFDDLWEPLGRLFDAFGMDRLMWGTDWTRAVELVTYADGVDTFRDTDKLSDDDKAALMGQTATTIYNWPG